MKNLTILLTILVAFIFACEPKKNNELGSDISTNPGQIKQGKELFNTLCSSCHDFKQKGIGPNLSGVTREIEAEWIKEFIKNPAKKIDEKDPRAKALFEQFRVYMQGFPNLKEEELNDLLSYIHTFEKSQEVAVDSIPFLENPIPDTIQSSGIVIELEFVTQIPASQNEPPAARINKIDCEKGSGRLFVHDLRGFLYELKDGKPNLFMSIKDFKKDFIHKPGLGTGLGSFAFHPEFMSNGLLYITHTEPAGTQPADFNYADSIPVTLQWVVTEWKLKQPTSETFEATNRELMRIDFVTGIHGMQEITFNPHSSKGNPDYGMLYLGVGDGGSAEKGFQHLSYHSGTQIWSNILRIDPGGSNSDNGNYGIPEDNPFASSSDKVKEIWAYGFRNPNRITWDASGRLLATDIGMHNIEELNVIEPGKFYGWPVREGTFLLNPYGDINKVYPLPDDDADYSVTYPLIQYDHDEGAAISGGFTTNESPLNGKYIFGDIPTGKFFVSDLSVTNPEIQKLDVSFKNQVTDWHTLSGSRRVDLRFGKGCNGEVYIYTKADGKIYKIKKM
ncbi:PQQ-dependent sugar dehydrogenase [Reichenbachiella sp. MALMAid0571]|uniref:PQQ-dependent sugar dehydrogenase n=1 Tax=Reichenbachiella sp. MALMAid0571 TaxID=3143939 RepID=UPI0032DE2DBE